MSAIGAHKVARALFQGCAVVCCGIHKAVLCADAVHTLIFAQIQRSLMIGGKGRLCCTGVLPDIRRGVALWRRIDGPEHQCVHQRQQDAHAKHRAGRAEPLEQRVPLHRHLGRILGTAAGSAGIGAVCPAHPAIHEQCHLRPDGERRNGKDEQKFNKSDPHRAFSFIFRAFSGGYPLIVSV